jgi:hypothetical protein
MHFLCQKNGISKLHYGFRWNQDRPEKNIGSLELTYTTKCDRDLKVYRIREFLSTIH